MRKIESYGDEQELLSRIEQLKMDGVQEESITVVSKESLEGSSFGYTNVNFKSATGTAWDKIVSFFSSEKPEERVVSSLNLSDSEQQEYKDKLESGKILLYVHDGSSDTAAKEPVADERQDTIQADEQTQEDATDMTAAGTAGTAGVTAYDDIANKEAPSGEYDNTDDQSANQIHNPANEEGVALSKTQEAHDHSDKLKEDDAHLAYGEGTDEHIAVDPSVDTDTEESDMEKIERHEDPSYLENREDEYSYKGKETVLNEYKMDDRRDQHLVDTHKHPELVDEVSPEDENTKEESRKKDDTQLIDKNPDMTNRDYSYKNDFEGEQVIRLDEEER